MEISDGGRLPPGVKFTKLGPAHFQAKLPGTTITARIAVHFIRGRTVIREDFVAQSIFSGGATLASLVHKCFIDLKSAYENSKRRL
jgi:hypothetical protein